MSTPGAGRLRRLAEELEESGLPLAGDPLRDLLLEEIDHALRPTVHERRVASCGSILEPSSDPAGWESGTQLEITRAPIAHHSLTTARRFADGLASWVLRRLDGADEWLLFDRPAGSERDLVVLAEVLDATLVQRHPSGAVRVAGPFGVLRWKGMAWHHEPSIRQWIDSVTTCTFTGDHEVLGALLEFAVHDLGSLGIGALLVYRPNDEPEPPVEALLPAPPLLRIRNPSHLGPLRHALAQIDGAAFFDGQGTLRRLGVRLIPSLDAEASVDALGGTRHTSARRYSYDDPTAIVVAVSDDGPVSVMRKGAVLGRSPDLST